MGKYISYTSGLRGAAFTVFCAACAAFVYPAPAGAQNKGEDTETRNVPAYLIPDNIVTADRDKIITFVSENDLYGSKGTDENYTNGFKFSYFDINADLPALAYNIADIVPTFDINRTSSVFYTFGHNIYTPSDITKRMQDKGDRPWAAHLYGSIGLATMSGHHLDEVELSLGIVGPYAMGEQIQKFFHSHVTTQSPTPKGWSNQIHNEPTVQLAWQRRYPHLFEADPAGFSFAASPYVGAALGNANTYANAGLNFRLTPETEKWQDAPLRVKPSLAGTGFFEIPESGWSWYLFAGAEGRAVARNIFLDGNTFRNSHSIDKKPLVYDLNAGLALTYRNYRLSYTVVRRSREFDGQDDPSVFGAISLGYRF